MQRQEDTQLSLELVWVQPHSWLLGVTAVCPGPHFAFCSPEPAGFPDLPGRMTLTISGSWGRVSAACQQPAQPPLSPGNAAWVPAIVCLRRCASPPGPRRWGPRAPHAPLLEPEASCAPHLLLNSPWEMTHSRRMEQSSHPFSLFSSLTASASTSQALTELPSGNLLIFSLHWGQGRPQGPASAPLGTHSQQLSHHKSRKRASRWLALSSG